MAGEGEIVAAEVYCTCVPACIATKRLEKKVASCFSSNLGERESSATKEGTFRIKMISIPLRYLLQNIPRHASSILIESGREVQIR
jgi:hypothetical protein